MQCQQGLSVHGQKCTTLCLTKSKTKKTNVFPAALGEGIVAAERHYDSMRAQLTAAAGVGGATALVSWGVAPLLGLQAPALLSAESAFWSFLIAASAGAVSNPDGVTVLK